MYRMQNYKSANYINGLPTWVLETSYSPSMLTVSEYHGKQASCSATVAIWVRCSPLFACKTDQLLNGAMPHAECLPGSYDC